MIVQSNNIYKFYQTCLSRIFPKHCLICWENNEYLCKSCKKKLLSHPEVCPSCHILSKHGKTCFSCKQKNYTLDGCIIAYSFTPVIKQLIYQLKYNHRYDVATFLSERLYINISAHEVLSQSNIIITYVPSHRIRRLLYKWYNQSKILWKMVAKLLWIANISTVTKLKHTTSQVKLNREQRKENLLHAFKSTLWKNNNIHNNTHTIIVIVDDITTTWSTLEYCAKEIKWQYPNIQVRWCVVARN